MVAEIDVKKYLDVLIEIAIYQAITFIFVIVIFSIVLSVIQMIKGIYEKTKVRDSQKEIR